MIKVRRMSSVKSLSQAHPMNIKMNNTDNHNKAQINSNRLEEEYLSPSPNKYPRTGPMDNHSTKKPKNALEEEEDGAEEGVEAEVGGEGGDEAEGQE